MSLVTSPEIPISESMKFNIEELDKKLKEKLGIDSQPHVTVCREGEDVLHVKVLLHAFGEDHFVEEQGVDFRSIIHSATDKLIRHLQKEREKQVSRRRRKATVKVENS